MKQTRHSRQPNHGNSERSRIWDSSAFDVTVIEKLIKDFRAHKNNLHEIDLTIELGQDSWTETPLYLIKNSQNPFFHVKIRTNHNEKPQVKIDIGEDEKTSSGGWLGWFSRK